jgi:hypothetical protein
LKTLVWKTNSSNDREEGIENASASLKTVKRNAVKPLVRRNQTFTEEEQ